MKLRVLPQLPLLLVMLLVLLAPWEAALASQSCLQSDSMASVAATVQCDSANNSCKSDHSSLCCQALCLLKARLTQNILEPALPMSRHWQLDRMETPLPGYSQQLLHPPAG